MDAEPESILNTRWNIIQANENSQIEIWADDDMLLVGVIEHMEVAEYIVKIHNENI